MTGKKQLNLSSNILTAGYLGLFAVSFILAKNADLDTAIGRHLFAGALSNGMFCFSMIMITNFALRKGEKWAWWSNFVPAIGYGLAILITDTLHVSKDKLFITLAPQVAGLLILSVGLYISGKIIFKKQISGCP